MKKIERLVNLIALLLDSTRPVPLAKIRRALYPDESDEAFRRKFERDKEELREAGIPIERATDVWEGDEGYRIPRQALLEDIGLTPDEQAALSLAAQAWEQGSGAGPGTALLKLSLASGTADAGAHPWILPRVETRSPNLDALLDAVARRKRVEFAYHTGGAAAAMRRSIDPYALGFRGAWYVAGFDHDREAVRVFKIDRIDGEVRLAAGARPDFEPPADAAAALPKHPWEGEATTRAIVAFAPEAAWWAERRTGAERIAERDDGWVEVELTVSDRDGFRSWVLGFGDQAEVVSPPDLRTEVIAALEALAGTRSSAR